MAGARRSARMAEKEQNSSPPSASKSGTKRKADETTGSQDMKAKRGRPAAQQKTLEETLQPSEDVSGDVGTHDTEDAKVETSDTGKISEQESANPSPNGKEETEDTRKNALDQVKASEGEDGKTSKPDESNGIANGHTEEAAVEEDKQREKAQPSNVLEKGVIYFFTRGRVGLDDPSSVQDIQRSYFVLRPLTPGSKLTDGSVQDVGNNRLIALPKKVWPKSGKDRFMVFVEKSKATVDTLKQDFFQGSDYSTKTTGTRHTPEVSLIGEGVYTMTASGDGRTTTHLAYMLTIPQEIGQVQEDIGLADKGSFVLSTKNPQSSAPSYALPATAEYPKAILDQFGNLGWLPTKPEHLDYDNASVLLIGENLESSNALEAKAEDEKSEEKEVPKEELLKLEDEDEERIKNLKGDKTVFVDLGISSKEYGLKSTW